MFWTDFLSFSLLGVCDADNFLGHEVRHSDLVDTQKLHCGELFWCALPYFSAQSETGPSCGTIIIPQTSSAPIKSVSQATPNGLDGYFSHFSSSVAVGYYVSGFRLSILIAPVRFFTLPFCGFHWLSLYLFRYFLVFAHSKWSNLDEQDDHCGMSWFSKV